MKEKVDLLILHGTLLTMNDSGTIIEGGGVAIKGDTIIDVDKSSKLIKKYSTDETINAKRKAIMPGLVDTYGHAGHGLIGGFHNPLHGWPAGRLYWQATTEEWWYAEAQLAATERLRFGTTTGASIIGSTPARTDSPIFGIRNAEAYAKVGIRAVLGVGPPDLFIPHIASPWSGGFLEEGKWIQKEFTYDDALSNAVKIIKKWHNGANGRIRIALAPAYLFGRHTARGRFGHKYTPENIPVMLEKAEEIRKLADQYNTQIHTHIFGGSIDFALKHFGRDRVENLLGTDVVIAHGNGLTQSEIKIVGTTRTNVATAPSTGENVWYGYAPILELLEAGANVTISTDGSAPRFSFDLFKDISRAMWHQWIKYNSMEVLPGGKALRMVTIDAAKALGIDKQVGSLEKGKKADIILIDLDQPHLTPETYLPHLLTYYVNGNDVDTVLVDGKILMKNKTITSVNKDEVLELARTEAEKAFERVELDDFKPSDRTFWHGTRYKRE